ncbi:MAG: L-asparaginase II [Chlorobi bacterium OLB7]|nr:MAG: L-asparaginase II [Chlorobi bacterium OLB7]
MTNATLALSLRGGRIEGWHRGSVAIADAQGHLLFSAGDPTMSTYLRSSIKMIQAIPVVRSGAADRFGFSEAELSVCCASHDGASYHLETVSGMLDKLGLAESALRCGGHDPHDRTQLGRLVCDHRKPGALYNNCSGETHGDAGGLFGKGVANRKLP